MITKLFIFVSFFLGAGPVTGPILASVFGWVPVLLWLLIGGLFFGAVQDFGALYASVKNEGGEGPRHRTCSGDRGKLMRKYSEFGGRHEVLSVFMGKRRRLRLLIASPLFLSRQNNKTQERRKQK